MLRRFALTASLLTVFLVVSAVVARPQSPGDTLDQFQTYITEDNYFIVGTVPFGTQERVTGQIFTAGLYGYLTRVQVYLENDASSPLAGGVMASIQTVTDDGFPSGREISSGSIGICADPAAVRCVPPAGSPGWVEIGLSPVVVEPGTRYAVVLRAWGGGRLHWFNHIGPSAYEAGFVVSNDGSGWLAVDYDDMTFRTYVRTPVLDQSQTVANDAVNVFPNYRVAQSFTAGTSGALHSVSVKLENDSLWPVYGPVTVSVWTPLTASNPLHEQIALGTIPNAAVPPVGYPAWVDVPVCCGNVSAGSQYIIVLSVYSGTIWWHRSEGDAYSGGTEIDEHSYWGWEYPGTDTAFQTYVLEPLAQSPPPPPAGIAPCVNGACPALKGDLTPADFTDGITAHFLFKERPNGTVQGIFDFTDELLDKVPLSGCTTESTACRLTVRTFACTGPQEMTVAGSFKRMGDEYASGFRLVASGVKNGPAALTLSVAGLTYSFTHNRMVDVTCPAGVTR